MIIGITATKGGSGKTTVCVNLAVDLTKRGFDVCIVDADAGQLSCKHWADCRDDDREHIQVVQLPQKKFIREVNELAKKYDIVLIDGRPTESDISDQITMVSDIVIIPVKFGLYEFSAFENYLNIFDKVQQAKEGIGGSIKGFALLNDIGVGQTAEKEMKEAVMEAIGESEVELLNTVLFHRKIYADSPADGIGVVESKDRKAKNEVENLTSEIEKVIKYLNK